LEREPALNAQLILPCPLWKVWRMWLSRNGRWRRKHKWPTVQLQGRAKVHGWTLRRLYGDDSLAVRQIDRALNSSFGVFVHLYAAFGIQNLV
jgi:hypothetical protein